MLLISLLRMGKFVKCFEQNEKEVTLSGQFRQSSGLFVKQLHILLSTWFFSIYYPSVYRFMFILRNTRN